MKPSKAAHRRIDAAEVSSVVLDQRLASRRIADELVRRPLRKREHMLIGVDLFLVQTATLDSYCIDEERSQGCGHQHPRRLLGLAF